VEGQAPVILEPVVHDLSGPVSIHVLRPEDALDAGGGLEDHCATLPIRDAGGLHCEGLVALLVVDGGFGTELDDDHVESLVDAPIVTQGLQVYTSNRWVRHLTSLATTLPR